MREIKRALTIAAIALLGAGPAAWAEVPIYRCLDGEVTVFSDRPCDESATPHESTGSLSFAGMSSEEVERIAERNREFIEARQERLAEQRRAETRPPAGSEPVAVYPRHPIVGTHLSPFFPHRDPPSAPRPPADEEAAAPGFRRGEGRFSALSGRQPGERRPERGSDPD